MFLVVLFAGWVNDQVLELGHDEWRIRERATQLLDNPLAALFVPSASEDAEVNYRLRMIRTRNLKWFSPVWVERCVLRASAEEWMRLYLFAGRSAIAERYETFERIHTYEVARPLFNAWPVMPGENEGFLYGSIYPGEYERWLAHLDYHRRRAPLPREK